MNELVFHHTYGTQEGSHEPTMNHELADSLPSLTHHSPIINLPSLRRGSKSVVVRRPLDADVVTAHSTGILSICLFACLW